MSRVNFLIFGTLLLFFCSCATTQSHKNTDPFESNLNAFFTTGLTEDEMPIDSLEKINMAKGKIYLYLAWLDIPNGFYNDEFKVYDAEKRLVDDISLSFQVPNRTWNSWAWHTFDRQLEKPGLWRFEVYVDHRLIITKEIEVVAD